MGRNITLVACVVGALIFYWYVPIDRLFKALQPLIVTLSIIVAAVFVRLNRGMPTLEWKSLDPTKRAELTSKIVDLTHEYAAIVAAAALACLLLLVLAVIGECDLKLWSATKGSVISGFVGVAMSLCIARMAYVVWRDVDVVKLQKVLIDTAAVDERSRTDVALAEGKLERMREATVATPPVPPPSTWDDDRATDSGTIAPR
jgi:hypothetical protein